MKTTFKAFEFDGTWSFGSTSYDEVVQALEAHGAGYIEVYKDGVLDDYIDFDDVDHWRQCSVCGALMSSGYFVEDGFSFKYFCSEECLHKEYTQEEYLDMYEDDTAFWTEW